MFKLSRLHKAERPSTTVVSGEVGAETGGTALGRTEDEVGSVREGARESAGHDRAARTRTRYV